MDNHQRMATDPNLSVDRMRCQSRNPGGVEVTLLDMPLLVPGSTIP